MRSRSNIAPCWWSAAVLCFVSRALLRAEVHVVAERSDVAQTLAAVIGPLPSVELDVFVERPPLPVALAADGAGVQLLARVRPYMVLHVIAGGEALEAEAAAVGPLAGVRPGVAVHGRRDVKAPPADSTAVRLLARVRPHVDLHVALAGEAFPAHSAAERLLARVATRVH